MSVALKVAYPDSPGATRQLTRPKPDPLHRNLTFVANPRNG